MTSSVSRIVPGTQQALNKCLWNEQTVDFDTQKYLLNE